MLKKDIGRQRVHNFVYVHGAHMPPLGQHTTHHQERPGADAHHGDGGGHALVLVKIHIQGADLSCVNEIHPTGCRGKR